MRLSCPSKPENQTLQMVKRPAQRGSSLYHIHDFTPPEPVRLRTVHILSIPWTLGACITAGNDKGLWGQRRNKGQDMVALFTWLKLCLTSQMGL